MRRFLTVLMCVLLMPFSFCVGEEAPDGSTLRALLVGADKFLSQPDTTPAAKNNLDIMESVLLSDKRGYARIRTESDTINSVPALREAVRDTFSNADEDDVSLFYISTHGIYNVQQSNLSAALVLSDGEREEQITALMLERMFQGIKGKKVLILDACNSGAFIGKGLSDPADSVLFVGEDYKVICSAGGSEESWYWQSMETGARFGASYFAAVFSNGLSSRGGYPADVNRDGVVTLHEAYTYVYDNYAVSTPQVYPQKEDSFPLLCYDVEAAPQAQSAVSDIVFEDTLFTNALNEVHFSFTVNRETTLMYQIVYLRSGVWQFSQARAIVDHSEGEYVTPGYKEKTLALTLEDEDVETSGYLMLQIFSRDADNRAWLEGGKLLSVMPAQGDMVLEVRAQNSAFSPKLGQELAVRVMHDVPCALTVSVQNMRGDTVAYLAYDRPTRPQHLTPEGTCLYWDGRLSNGEYAPPGSYTVRVRTVMAGDIYVAYSSAVVLNNDEGMRVY